MTNNSASGGYLLPQTPELPKGLTFTQFLQTVLVGISGLDGTLVRPGWQLNPPKQPDQSVNWLAFGVVDSEAKGFPYQGNVNSGTPGSPVINFQTQYHSKVTLKCDLYGPNCFENFGLIRDGFYLTQNNEALVSAGFGLVGVGKAIRNPELIDELWFDRYVFFIELMYEQRRSYPILSFASANGTIFFCDPKFELPWLVKEEA